MKPARFDYLCAADAAEVLETLHQEGGEARVIAGGQSLMPMLNMRLARPGVLVDVMHVAEWQRITDTGAALRIGAAVRQVTVERHPGLAIPRPAAGAHCAARWLMPTLALNCRWCWWRSAAACICARVGGPGRWRRRRSLSA